MADPSEMDDLFELEDSELDPESKFASEFASELNVEVKKKWEEFKDALLSGNCDIQKKFNAIFCHSCTIVIYVGFINAEEIEEMFLPVCDRVTEIKSGMDSIKGAMQYFQKFEDIKRHVADTKKCLCDAPKLLNSDQLAKSIIEYEKNLKPVENITLCIADGLKRIKNRYEELNTKENIYQDNKNVFETTMKLIESSIDIINSAVKVYTSPVNQFEAIRGGMKVIQSAYKEMKLEFAIFKRRIFGFRRSDKSQLIPPMVLSLSPEQMNKHALQALTWTKSEQIQSKVSNFLEECQPFFFYTNSLYSNTSPATHINRVVNVVCREIYWDHYFLVIGDDSDLEEELMQDIGIVASLAQLDDFEIKRLHDLLTASDSSFSKRAFIYGTKAVLTCLIFPSNSELKTLLTEKMTLNPGRSFTIIYSGHAWYDGSWVLPEGDSFDASDLMEVINEASSGSTNFPPIKILLNCCYGWVFANGVGEIDTFIEFLECELRNSGLNQLSSQQLKNMLTGKDGSSEVINNKKIVDIFLDTYKKILPEYKNSPATVQNHENNLDISFLSFSVGPLHAEGILKSFYKIQPCVKVSQLDWSRIRVPLSRRVPVHNSIPPDPQLIVFPAHRGDSTLFRWHGFNMLVDGGLIKNPPCFWETVRRLPNDQQLDVVVVTHFDADHINGIMKLFDQRKLPINVGNLYTVGPPPANRSASQGTNLWKKAKSHLNEAQLNNLATNPQLRIVRNTFPNGDVLEVFMVTPNNDDLQEALDILPCRKTESEIANAASASLLIKCTIQSGDNQEYRYALLTGDAPGNTIIARLADTDRVAHIPKLDPEAAIPVYCFDYIDMPHHGSASATTAPQAFLAQVNAHLCVVSTNSKNYNHPDADTVTQLQNALPERIGEVLFTYQAARRFKYKREMKTRNLSNEFDKKSTHCRFAPNNIDNKNAQSCIKVNLYNHEYQFCNNNSVIDYIAQ